MIGMNETITSSVSRRPRRATPRGGRRGLPLLVLLLAAALLGACGGDDESEPTAATADEYRSALDSACEETYAALTGLPQKAQDESLEIAEVEALAQEAGDRFVSDVESLQPPAELEQSHGALLDALHDEPANDAGLEAVAAQAADLTGIYVDLGASRCEALQRKAVNRVQQAEEAIPVG